MGRCDKKQEKLKKKLEKLQDKQLRDAKNKEEAAAKRESVMLNKRIEQAKKAGGDILVVRDVVLNDAILSSSDATKRVCAPDGINGVPLRYVTTQDAGGTTYHAVMYVEELPSMTTFVHTFSPLFNFGEAVSSVHIEPLGDVKSRRLLNKRIIALGTEQLSAHKSGDPNRIREIDAKYAEAQSWAAAVEAKTTVMYKVAMYFKLHAQSYEKLVEKCCDFYNVARESGIELSACYGGQAEALLSSAPFNKIYNPRLRKSRYVKASGMKYHIMDKYSLCTIFDHTQSNFTHKNGIVVGRNLSTLRPIVWDPYDKSHNGYCVCISGVIGSGKSGLVKMWSSRYVDFDDCRLVFIDLDSSTGTEGEYVREVERLGGISFTLAPEVKNRLNLFDISPSKEYDAETRTEYMDLRLSEKINDMLNIIMCMIKDGKQIEQFASEKYIRRIVGLGVKCLYDSIGLIDRDVASLYTEGTVYKDGALSVGKVKKTVPILSDYYLLIMKMAKENENAYYREAYELILSSLAEWLDCLVYGKASYRRFTLDEYEQMGVDEYGHKVVEYGDGFEEVCQIKGVRPYFDGKSTIEVSDDLIALDLDISLLPERDKLVAQEICCNFVNENYVKRNSADPRKINKLLFIIDEFHRMFSGPDAIKFVADLYRTSRKKYVCMWTITQSVSDYDLADEGRIIYKMSNTKLILKQDRLDERFLREATPLTESQISQVTTMGGARKGEIDDEGKHKGEVCLIDNNNVVFLKVDYLQDVEADIVETDASRRYELHKKGVM